MKIDISYSPQVQPLTKDLSLLSEVVARTQAAEQVVTWNIGSDLIENRLLTSLLKIFMDSMAKRVVCPILDQIVGFSTFDLCPEVANKHVKSVESEIISDPSFPSRPRMVIRRRIDQMQKIEVMVFLRMQRWL